MGGDSQVSVDTVLYDGLKSTPPAWAGTAGRDRCLSAPLA